MSETTKAANALIQWFNSQEISQSEALAVMNKVAAKIIVGDIRSPTTADVRQRLDDIMARLHTDLAHEINERLYETRTRRNPR